MKQADTFDFEKTYRTKYPNWKGIAFHAICHAKIEGDLLDPDDEESGREQIDDPDHIVVVMVGDDKRHIVETDMLVPLEEGEYCPSCGQIGCGHA